MGTHNERFVYYSKSEITFFFFHTEKIKKPFLLSVGQGRLNRHITKENKSKQSFLEGAVVSFT